MWNLRWRCWRGRMEKEKERKQGVASRVREECGEEWKCVAIRSVTMTRRESALRSLE